MTDEFVHTRQHTTPYADALLAHRDRLKHHFRTPGHAYGPGRLRDFLGEQAQLLDIPQLIYGIDIGENSAYEQSLDLAAEAWGARTTWFLTNGASQGNRMAMMATGSLGNRMLIQRSSHSSVYDGLVMSGIEPVYLMPHIDETHQIAQVVTAAGVEQALIRERDAGTPISAVLIVSPNYFGSIADVTAIAQVCEAHAAMLIVDGSWGAHFGFHPKLPESPLRQGADILLSSIHKLGGSMTQTAMLHLAEGHYADTLEPALNSAYRLTESTSLNSMLLASLDIARAELVTEQERIEASLTVAEQMRQIIRQHPDLRLAEDDFTDTPGIMAVDPLHIVIDVRGLGVTGTDLQYYMGVGETASFVEIATPTAVVALIGAGAAPDGAGMIEAIVDAAEAIPTRGDHVKLDLVELPPAGKAVMTPREAYLRPTETVSAAEAVGRVAADMLAAYPPGIPNVVPGEVITQEAVDYLQYVAGLAGGHVRGALQPDMQMFRVCVESHSTSE